MKLWMFLVGQLKGDLYAPKYVLVELHVQKLQCCEALLVDDSKSAHEPYVRVVDTIMINMYSLCTALGCWC